MSFLLGGALYEVSAGRYSLFLRMDDGMKFLKVNTIRAVSAAGDYTEVITSGPEGGLTSKSMKEWEARLPADRFCRIHRSTIINLDYVEKVEDRGNYTFDVFLKGMKQPMAMSRRYSAALKHRLK
jgi:DNA-binding LytR/AlgR family response regulator